MDNKDIYRKLCENEPTIPIFSRDWWLDAVCEGSGHWEAAIVEKGGKVMAAMPYYTKRKYGFTIITQPCLTQTLGPWLCPSNAKYAKALSEEKDLIQQLIDQLPEFDHFIQSWSFKNLNWLPFYWNGFKQTTNYTYVIPDLSDSEHLWSEMQANIRTDIRKAESRLNLRIRDDVDLDEFIRLNRLTYNRQGIQQPYSDGFIHRLDSACVKHHCRKIWVAEDPEGRHHAGIYIVWDENSAYYIMGGSDPKLRNSGATSLCMWHAILHASTVTKRFDFEGSMIESIERYFRAFGARQHPYFTIYKTPSLILKTSLFLRDVLRT